MSKGPKINLFSLRRGQILSENLSGLPCVVKLTIRLSDFTFTRDSFL